MALNLQDKKQLLLKSTKQPVVHFLQLLLILVVLKLLR